MKLCLIVAVMFLSKLVNPYSLELVPEVTGLVEVVSFDSDGNIYAVTLSVDSQLQFNHTLLKLSPERELLLAVELPFGLSLVNTMHITRQKDIYFQCYDEVNYNNTFAILRSDSETIESVKEIWNDFFYLDPEDNLYYGTHNGLHILRPGSKTPIQIKNLKTAHSTSTKPIAVDKEGNIYLCAEDRSYNDLVALLTKVELQNKVPKAELLDVLDDPSERVTDIVVDERNEIWITTKMPLTEGYIKILKNGSYEIIKIDPKHPDLDVTATKDRIWVVAAYITPDPTAEISPASIYYVKLDGEVVDIPELQNLSTFPNFYSKTLADKDGRVYFESWYDFTEALGPMIIINPGETKPNPVTLVPNDLDKGLRDIFMDVNENVWIFGTNIIYHDSTFVIRKGETVANKIQDFSRACSGVYSNVITTEVFLACDVGLFLAVDDK